MCFAIFAAYFGSIKHILFRKLRYDNERRYSTKEEVRKDNNFNKWRNLRMAGVILQNKRNIP